MFTELKKLMWLATPKGEGTVIGVIDYGPEAELYWVVAQQNGEIWTWPNDKVRLVKNISLGRDASGESVQFKIETFMGVPLGEDNQD